MRVKVDTPEGDRVRACRLDGKIVPTWEEADDEEGWVSSWIPVLPKQTACNGQDVITDEAQQADFDLVKRYGKVKFVFENTTPVVDKQDPKE